MVVDYTATGNSFSLGTPRVWSQRRLDELRVNAIYDLVLSKNSNALKIRYMTVPVANLELNENMVLASNCDYAVGLPASGPHGMREW